MTDAGLTEAYWFYEMERGERAMRVARYLADSWTQAMTNYDRIEDMKQKGIGNG